MKKMMLLGAALVLTAAAWALNVTVTETSAAGTTIVATQGVRTLSHVTIGDVAGTGDFAISVYDSATGATTASLKRYTLFVPAAITNTTNINSRMFTLGGEFVNGITISTDGFTNTVTASWHHAFSRQP